ncbi:MAG: response regulator [Stellaceae bacterium]
MPSSEQPGGGVPRRRILLVEDEILVATLIESMLAEFGYEIVGPIAHVGKAIEMAQQEVLHAAILDVNIRGQEVYPVAEALTARGIPYIFSTGYGNGGLRASYRNRPTLTKPFLRRDLLHVIEVCGASTRDVIAKSTLTS